MNQNRREVLKSLVAVPVGAAGLAIMSTNMGGISAYSGNGQGLALQTPVSSPIPKKLTPEEMVARELDYRRLGLERWLDHPNPWEINEIRWFDSSDPNMLQDILKARGLQLEHMEGQYWKAGDRVFYMARW